MSITMRNIFDKTMALIDEYSSKGVRLDKAKTADFELKAILLADMAQKELYSVAKIEKTFNFSNTKIPNLLNNNEFNQVDFIGKDQFYPLDGILNAKAYYFESTGGGICIIEENVNGTWLPLITLALTESSSYNAYKGVITPSNSNNKVRLRFTGTTFYRHRNRAIYSYPFTLSQIPIHSEWIEVDLPDDFMSMRQIVSESVCGYSVESPYKWEQPNRLFVRYDFDSNYRLIYYPIPKTVISIDDVLECNDIIGQAIPYYIASKLAPFENQSLVTFYESKYNELKFDASKTKMSSWEKVASNYMG